MIAWGVRVLLVALLLGSGWRVFEQLVARQVSRLLPGVEGLQEAIRWDPTGADYYLELGLHHLDQLDPALVDQAGPLLERAAELNAFEPRALQELARLYEVEGRRERAERAFLRATELSPTVADPHWRLGNFYLRSGELQKALPQFERAMDADSGLVRTAATLLLGVGVDPGEVERLTPSDERSRRQLLDVLSSQLGDDSSGQRLFATLQVWRAQLAARALTVPQGSFLIKRLLQAGLYEAARREWAELNAANGHADAAFAARHNLIWNGDFELPVFGGALDWQLPSAGGYVARLEEVEGGAGSALELVSSGDSPGGLRRAQQQVVVEGGQRYVLTARWRAEGFGPGPAPRLEILGADSRQLLAMVDGLEPDGRWRDLEVMFETADKRQLIVVRLGDTASSEREGVAWIDAIMLRPTQ